MQELHLWAVLVAAVANLVIGGFWYSERIFGKICDKLKNKTASKKPQLARSVGSFITYFVKAGVLAYLFSRLGVYSFAEASLFAFLIWLGFNATSMFSAVLWNKKPLKLYFIHAGYSLVSLQVIAWILTFLK
ncbi:MAG: DUF1761 domain-containing protein [Chlamydiota bacterium]